MSTGSSAAIEHDGLVFGPDDVTDDDEVKTRLYVRPTVRPFRPTDGTGGPPIAPGHPAWEPIREYLERRSTPQDPFQERANAIVRNLKAIPISARAVVQEAVDSLVDQANESLHIVLGPSAPKLAHLSVRTLGRGGRKKLKESPSSPALPLAKQALELLAGSEVATHRDAAVRLGMPRYDATREDLDGKAEENAERRLRRYIKTFRTSEGVAE